MQPVERFGSDTHRGIESKGRLCRRDVVIGRFRHANDRYAHLEKLQANLERPVAPDDDETVEAEFLEIRDDFLRSIDIDDTFWLFLRKSERVAVIGRPEYRTARVQNAANVDRPQRAASLDVEKPTKAFLNTDRFPAERVGASHDGADHRVQAGAVAAARQNTHAFSSFHERTLSRT